MVFNILNVSILFPNFWYCVKLIFIIKRYMKRIDVSNINIKIIFLCHLSYPLNYRVSLIRKKYIYIWKYINCISISKWDVILLAEIENFFSFLFLYFLDNQMGFKSLLFS